MATPYYNIPTLNATDTIDLVTDINAMMNAIDTAMHDITSGGNSKLEQLQTVVTGLHTALVQVQKTVRQLQGTISSYEKITTYGDLDQYGAITTKEA
jgi:hypothetical protein